MKASSSYAPQLRGVSQQIPQERGPGQISEQINMLSDPVEGLSRRHGSLMVAEKSTGLAWVAAADEDVKGYRTFSYSSGGNDYEVMVRHASRPSGSTLPALMGFNRTTGQFLTYARPVTDAQLDLMEQGGVSAITNVGKYLFMAGHSTLPTATSTDLWAAADNQAKSVLWVRGGAYSRTYKATVTKTDNTQVSFEYTTPKSSYPGTLDTSGVPIYAADPAGGTQLDTEAAYITADGAYGIASLGWAAWNPTGMTVTNGGAAMTNVTPADPANATEYKWVAGAPTVRFHASLIGDVNVTMEYTHTKVITNPNYVKTVDDLTNEYQSAVTAWIGTAAEAIQPQAIAEQLKLAAIAAGLTTATRSASTVIFDNVKAISATDSGDNTLLRGVANEVTGADEVSSIHAVNKVVKIRARGSAEAYYLKAVAKDSAVTSGYTEVTWVEGAGVQHAITGGLIYATVQGSSLFVASSASLLDSIITGPAPVFVASTVGDVDTSPLPYFIGKKITWLGVFQDRLLVGAGGIIRASKIGDYLNFFRASVLTVPANDPLEMTAQGAEDDELRYSELYEKNLVVFGKKRQYVISGSQPLTPTAPSFAVLSSHADAAEMPPLAVGGLIFYGKLGEVASSVHQIQPSPRGAESPQSFIVSSQLKEYITKDATEFRAIALPAALFVRTKTSPNSLFIFQYLDRDDGRAQDSWSRWEFNSGLGKIAGMASTPNGLLVFTLRVLNGIMWLVADNCPLTSGLSTKPYLDSMRTWSAVTEGLGTITLSSGEQYAAAFDASTEWKFLGAPMPNATDLPADYPLATGLWGGALQNASMTPTNPFMRDRNDEVISTGRLTVTNVVVSTGQSSGFTATVTDKNGSQVYTYNGRIIGDPNNLIGRTPISNLQQSVVIARETRDYTLTLAARDWLPFTITSMEWVGQFFNHTRRL